jgi:hypothetical protein
MVKVIITFLLLWGVVTGLIGMWRHMPNNERWSTVKVATYGLVTATITFVILSAIVILF